MRGSKYSPGPRARVIKDFEATGDAKLVADKHSIPEHAVYRIRREQLVSPEVFKDKKIRELTQEFMPGQHKPLLYLLPFYLSLTISVFVPRSPSS